MKFHRFARDLFVAALLMLPFAPAVKAEPVSDEAIDAPEELAVPTANVMLDGKVLFRVRGASAAYPAEQRAQSILERIMTMYTDLHHNILDVFNEYGVQIMTPAYEGDPPQPKVVPRDQ